MQNKLAYYVYIENFNKKCIEKYNVLSDHFVKLLKAKTHSIEDKATFAEKVKSVLMYHFWSKCEWEVVITDWPTHIETKEVIRLQAELQDYITSYGHEPYSLSINLKVADKIDVYDQIMLNWDIFIDYLWKGLGRE